MRFICGTQGLHKELEHKIANFVKMDDCILYSSCFDANGGLFETLLGPEDAVISDELNHASIIDGVRLCKAKRYRYKNNNMEDLRAQLQDAKDSGCKIKLIATDGVFSMDGYIANLKGICDLADEFDALVMVDDSHAVGFMGEHGRGTAEYCGVEGRVDIITGTLGKALGGASGGYTAARQEIVDLAPPAQPSIPLFKYRCPRYLRRGLQDHRYADREHRPPGQGTRKCPLLPRRDGKVRLRPAARRASIVP